MFRVLSRLTEPTDVDDDLAPFRTLSSAEFHRDGQHRDFGRLVAKSGRLLVQHDVPSRIRQYGGTPVDCFFTLLHSHWWVTITWFALAYLASWTAFALGWLVVHLANPQACLNGLTGFRTAFVFSIETQATVGYGEYKIDGDCAAGVVLLSVQCIAGSMLDACLLGLVFAKLARPRSRRRTIAFSETACLSQLHPSSDHFLMFRIGDVRKNHLLEAHVRAHVYFKKHTTLPNGKVVYPFDCFELDLGFDGGRDRVFTLLPVVVWHRVDRHSPLWGIGERELGDIPLEIIVVLEGIVEAIGAVTAAVTSYTGEEVVVNQRFAPMVRFSAAGRPFVDFKLLHRTVPVPERDPLACAECAPGTPGPAGGPLHLLSQNEPEPRPALRGAGDLLFFGGTGGRPQF